MEKEFEDVMMTCRGCGKNMWIIPNIKKGTKITGLHKECLEGNKVFRENGKQI